MFYIVLYMLHLVLVNFYKIKIKDTGTGILMKKTDKRKILSAIKTEKFQIRLIAVGLILFLVLMLIPLFQISHYSFISTDDYSFLAESLTVWRQTHSVGKVLLAQIHFTYDFYQTWQGTYFDVWLLSSLLGFFAENAYYMGTYLSLGGLVTAELISFLIILRKVLHADYCRSIIVAISCIAMQVLLTSVPVEAYYWFTSAIMYTFIYGLTVLLGACLVLLYHSPSLSTLRMVLLNILILFLNIAIGGSNYITALCTLLIYLAALAYFCVRRHRWRFVLLLQSILFSTAFLINMTAPGNQIRQASSGVSHLPALQSILLSLKEAAHYLTVWIVPPVMVLGILLIPIIWKIVDIRKYKYPFPALVSLVSFGLFAAQFTPTIYALGITGAGRVLNLYRFSMFIWLYGNEIYWIGWLKRRPGISKSISVESIPTENTASTAKTSWLLPAWLAGGMILLFSLHIWAGDTLTSVSAWKSLRSGEAMQYYAEYQERLTVLQDDTQKEVVLAPYSVKPYLLFFHDIVEDSDDWVNREVAGWYHKTSVILQE